MAKNTICLWYDKDAEAAARFYAETFPDSAVSAIHRAPSDYPSGKAGDVLTRDDFWTSQTVVWNAPGPHAGYGGADVVVTPRLGLTFHAAMPRVAAAR